MIAGATSGVGKTLVSCGVIHALKKQGYSVQPFKVGPDYIDPGYLSSISGNDACNLDVWLMGRNQILRSFVSNSNCDISVIEGVMGFYDGFGGNSNLASTHHVAAITKSPVILVLDASKTSRSVAAIVLGFQKFHKNSRIRGVILNKLGSRKHELLCRQALEQTGIPILGSVYKNPQLILKSQHLGLVPPASSGNIQKMLSFASQSVADSLDLPRILEIIRSAPSLSGYPKPYNKRHRARIAVALDGSFNFYYRDNLAALQREGATLDFFSPAKDRLPPASDGLYIGGGFPEVIGRQLERNATMRNAIRKMAEDGMPVYAECGGLMYLTRSITHGDRKYRMAGLFDADTRMTKRMKLNYTKGQAKSKSIVSCRPHTFHGHEFHYSELDSIPPDSKFAYRLNIGAGITGCQDGMMLYNTLASYGHLYFDSSYYAASFLNSCVDFSRL